MYLIIVGFNNYVVENSSPKLQSTIYASSGNIGLINYSNSYKI